jgi:hypothetical protein
MFTRYKPVPGKLITGCTISENEEHCGDEWDMRSASNRLGSSSIESNFDQFFFPPKMCSTELTVPQDVYCENAYLFKVFH